VFDQARALLRNPDVAPSPLEPDLAKLVALLHRNGRGSYLKLILNTFVRMYCFSTNTRLAHLTTAVPAEGLEEKTLQTDIRKDRPEGHHRDRG